MNMLGARLIPSRGPSGKFAAFPVNPSFFFWPWKEGTLSTKPWFKCYPSDFLRGVAHLSPNELALYTIALMEMYDSDGPIPDKIEWLARRCNMRPTTCEKALKGLIEAGKLIPENGLLINDRAQKSLESRRKVGEKSAINISKRWNKSPDSINKINGSDSIPYEKPDTEPIPTRSQKPKLDNTPAPNGATPLKRGHRLSDDWTLPEDWQAWAIKEGWLGDRVALEAEKFRDYWISASGQNASKRDWLATWRNWMRRVPKDDRSTPGQSRKSPHDKAFAGFRAAATEGNLP